MIRSMSAALAALALAAGAHAAPAGPSYAVLSLVGDKLDMVTYQMATGSQLDANTHIPVALPQDEFDLAALRAINRSLKATVPGAQVTLLAASRPEDFADQETMFGGGHVRLPAEIDAAVKREGVATLVLVTKHRGDARVDVTGGRIGSGRVEGLGFYLDGLTKMHRYDASTHAIGFIAPFVYVEVSLVDVASGTVTRQATIAAGRAIGAYANKDGINAWDALSAADKVSTLSAMLTEQLDATVPALIAGSAAR